MSFYTCVNRYGSNILFRGYTDEGKRIQTKIPFKPTMYLKSQANERGWKSFDGVKVDPIELDSMSEATEFVKKYENVDNFKIYGNNNFVAQFIQEKFPGVIKYDLKRIEVGNIDIEVASDDGFPEPDEAKHPVISIAYKSSASGVYHVWGLGEWRLEDCELDIPDNLIQYRQ